MEQRPRRYNRSRPHGRSARRGRSVEFACRRLLDGLAKAVKDCGAKAPSLPEQGDVDVVPGVEIGEVARGCLQVGKHAPAQTEPDRLGVVGWSGHVVPGWVQTSTAAAT